MTMKHYTIWLKVLVYLVIIFISNFNGMSQDIFHEDYMRDTIQLRKVILKDLQEQDYSNCVKKLNENISLIKEYRLFSFNEYWMINLMCNRPITIHDFFTVGSLRKKEVIRQDSLSFLLYKFAVENELQLKNRLYTYYDNKEELTANLLYFDMILVKNPTERIKFKEYKNTIFNEMYKNELLHQDSSLYMISRIIIPTKNYGISLDSKIFLSDPFNIPIHGTNWSSPSNRIISKVGINFDINKGIFTYQISIDKYFAEELDFINTSEENGYIISRNNNSSNQSPIIKQISSIGMSSSFGINLLNNDKLNTSISIFDGYTSFDKGFRSAGIIIDTKLYLFKGREKVNIDKNNTIRKHLKLTIGYDLFNECYYLGIGTGFTSIRDFKLFW